VKRIVALVSGIAVMAGLGLFASPASAGTVWKFPTSTFTLSDGYGGTVTVTARNLTVDGSTATGYLSAQTDRYGCSTSAFTDLSAYFFTGSFAPCSGTVTFSVDPSTGVLTASSGLTIASRLFVGAMSGSAQGTAQKPPVVPLTGCSVTRDDAAREFDFTLSGGNPDATDYSLEIKGSGLPVVSTGPGTQVSVEYSFLTYGSTYTATITATRADGAVVATCDMTFTVPWVAPGKPTIDSLVPAAGGLLTVNYSVADPTTVLGIEYKVGNGSWSRPGGTAPIAGSGGAFTITGLAAGKQTVTLRSVGLDPTPMTTESDPKTATIPSATAAGKPTGSSTTNAIGSSASNPVAVPPSAPVSSVPGTSNGAGTGTRGALAANTGDAGIDAPCLAPNGTLYPNQYSTVGSQLTMAPNTTGMGDPVSFAVTAGALPPGIALDRDYGVLFGVTTQAGSWVTTVRATFTDGSTKSSQFTTRVDADAQTLQYAALNIGWVGADLQVSGTTNAPATGTTYSLICGQLPAGTTLNTRTGVISGKPTDVLFLPTPIRIAETSGSGKAAASFLIIVGKPNSYTAPTMSYPAHPHARVGKPIKIQPTLSGFTGVTEFRLWKGTLPRGLHLNRLTGVITGRVTRPGPAHTVTIVAHTQSGAWVKAAPMRLTISR